MKTGWPGLAWPDLARAAQTGEEPDKEPSGKRTPSGPCL